MIGIRSAFSIRARGHRPHLEAVYMTAPRSVCRNTKKALPTGGRPYMTANKKHHDERKEIIMIEFFFDCSSPWTYLAFHNIQPLAKELGAEISWRPILVGGIFNTVNPSVYASRETPVPLKSRYMKKDLADWARSAGLAIKMPPTVFPVNSVKAMRGCVWLGKDMVPFARAIFAAYWGDDKDISKDEVLTGICNSLGIDSQKFLAGISEQAIKDQ